MNAHNAQTFLTRDTDSVPCDVCPEYSLVDASPEATCRSNDRRLLTSAIMSLPLLAKERHYNAISSKTLNVAVDLLSRLPINRALPKVAVDEDGDILMEWNETTGACSLTVEGETLHMVINPGSNSNHLDPVIYNGGYFPPAILSHIPIRRL